MNNSQEKTSVEMTNTAEVWRSEVVQVVPTQSEVLNCAICVGECKIF